MVRGRRAVGHTFVYKVPEMARRTSGTTEEPRQGGDSMAKATRKEVVGKAVSR